jgi:hypothetical protein
MAQVSWRAADDLVEQVRSAARTEGRSLNDYVTHVLRAAVDPSYAGDEVTQVRERLARAGLLANPTGRGTRTRPDPARLAAARAAAGRGTPLGELIGEGRG